MKVKRVWRVSPSLAVPRPFFCAVVAFPPLSNVTCLLVIAQVESTHATRTSEKTDQEGQEQKPEAEAQTREISARVPKTALTSDNTKGNSDKSGDGDCVGNSSAGSSAGAGTATGNGGDKGSENRVETGAHKGDGAGVNSDEAKDANTEKRGGASADKGVDTTSVAVPDTAISNAAPTITTTSTAKSEGRRNGSETQGREDSKPNPAEEENRALKMTQRRRKSTGSDGRKPEPQRAVGYPMTAVSAVLRQLHRRVLTDEEMAMLDKVSQFIDAVLWDFACIYKVLYYSVKSRGKEAGWGGSASGKTNGSYLYSIYFPLILDILHWILNLRKDFFVFCMVKHCTWICWASPTGDRGGRCGTPAGDANDSRGAEAKAGD